MRCAHGCTAWYAVGRARDRWYIRRMTSTTPANAKAQALKFRPIAPGVSIGHIHLKVAQLERAIAFYRDVLGFELTERYGRNTWESQDGQPPPAGTTGLFHAAILYPTRADLADALRRLLAHGIRIDGASDHGVSEAIYLRDPDGNGLELYWDRPRPAWPRLADGSLAMFTQGLNLESLLTAR